MFKKDSIENHTAQVRYIVKTISPELYDSVDYKVKVFNDESYVCATIVKPLSEAATVLLSKLDTLRPIRTSAWLSRAYYLQNRLVALRYWNKRRASKYSADTISIINVAEGPLGSYLTNDSTELTLDEYLELGVTVPTIHDEHVGRIVLVQDKSDPKPYLVISNSVSRWLKMKGFSLESSDITGFAVKISIEEYSNLVKEDIYKISRVPLKAIEDVLGGCEYSRFVSALDVLSRRSELTTTPYVNSYNRVTYAGAMHAYAKSMKKAGSLDDFLKITELFSSATPLETVTPQTYDPAAPNYLPLGVDSEYYFEPDLKGISSLHLSALIGKITQESKTRTHSQIKDSIRHSFTTYLSNTLRRSMVLDYENPKAVRYYLKEDTYKSKSGAELGFMWVSPALALQTILRFTNLVPSIMEAAQASDGTFEGTFHYLATNDVSVSKSSNPAVTYFFQTPEGVKIGRSSTLYNRLKTHCSSWDIDTVYVVDADIEHDLHKYFSEHKVSSKRSDEIFDVSIEEVQDKCFSLKHPCEIKHV